MKVKKFEKENWLKNIILYSKEYNSTKLWLVIFYTNIYFFTFNQSNGKSCVRNDSGTNRLHRWNGTKSSGGEGVELWEAFNPCLHTLRSNLLIIHYLPTLIMFSLSIFSILYINFAVNKKILYSILKIFNTIVRTYKITNLNRFMVLNKKYLLLTFSESI